MALSHALAFARAAVKRWQGYVWAGLWSREILEFRVPTFSNDAEGHVYGGVLASRRGTLRGQRARARTEISLRENREVPRSPAASTDAPSWMVRGVVDRHRRAVRGTLRR
jgi:hypothetical protein